MPLRIVNAGPEPAEVVSLIRAAIEEALPGADVRVSSGGPGHYEVAVRSAEFADKSRVAQHQRVYAAIAHLMSGSDAPVHAVDRLECSVP